MLGKMKYAITCVYRWFERSLPVPSPLNKTALAAVINRFAQQHIAVIGDMAIDEMIYGKVDRLSREAPVLILKHDKTDVILGAGANAAHNVACYGAETHAIGLCGQDYYAGELVDAFHRDGVNTQAMVVDSTRPTTTKTRISGVVNASVTQQMVRLDREARTPITATTEAQLLANINTIVPTTNGLLLSDYAIGVVTPAIIAQVQALAKQHQLPWAVDSQQPLVAFQGASIMTPNQPEAEHNVGFAIEDKKTLLKAGMQLLTTTQAENILITLGNDGMALFSKDTHAMWHIPVFNRSKVFDVTGAGDTVVATLLLANTCGASWLEAAVLGNLAASLVVKQFGAAVTNQSELLEALEALDDELLAGISHTPLPTTN
jgi:rfaE bifunctional protein kinase chain/domain